MWVCRGVLRLWSDSSPTQQSILQTEIGYTFHVQDVCCINLQSKRKRPFLLPMGTHWMQTWLAKQLNRKNSTETTLIICCTTQKLTVGQRIDMLCQHPCFQKIGWPLAHFNKRSDLVHLKRGCDAKHISQLLSIKLQTTQYLTKRCSKAT